MQTDQNDYTPEPPATDPPPADNGRPGGAPARSLADDRIAALEQQIADLGSKITESNAQAAQHKGAKRTMEDQVQELIAAQTKTQQELHLAKIETSAAKVGARNPAVVARLVAGSDNYLADLERLKTEEPYLFGPPVRAAGADMNGGDSGGATGLDGLDKFLAEQFNTRG